MKLLPSLGFLALLAGCDPVVPLPDSPEGTIRHAVTQLADHHDPGVLWDLLPASYQNDVQGWCRELAKRLPAAEYEKAFTLIREVGKVLKLHADSIGDNLLLKSFLQVLVRSDSDDIAAASSATGDVLLLLGRSELNTIAGLARADLGEFLHGTGKTIGRSAIRAVRVTGQDPIATARTVAVEVEAQTAVTARLRLRVEGLDETIEFVRLEGRWVPKLLAERWPDIRAGGLEAIAALDIEGATDREQLLDELIADAQAMTRVEGRAKFERLITKAIEKYRQRLGKPR